MAKKGTKEVVKTEPARAISPLEEMEKRFEDFFRKPFSLIGPTWWPRLRMPELEEITPTVDIYEEAGDVVIKADLPGMKKENIDVNISGDTVTISGEKKKEEKVEKKNYYSIERSYGSFKRTFRMPAEVQADKAKANFKDGVLELRVPRTEEAKKKEKKVAIE
ncbi:MAG: Hsp20/alpha crystallin family protein [Thermodesulfovibrionales bacterium]|nr:Hsp20/alpha crystallin family protein [Thermodesulfovibrionales bacterium]